MNISTMDSAPSGPGVSREHSAWAPTASAVLHLPQTGGGVPYYVQVPGRVDPSAHPLIAVHGISRRAQAHLRAFASWAEDRGRILIAPLFAESYCQRYQKMLLDRRRADRALFSVLDDITATTGIAIDRFDLFGFSGGAQFAHRFALMYPGHIRRLVLASAGWYTLPDPAEAYPYGLARGENRARHFRPCLEDALAIPTLVLVGDRDVLRDSGLRKEPSLDRHQGRTRVERAARWTGAMRHVARQAGLSAEIRFQTIAGCGHSFEECVSVGGLADMVTDWCDKRENYGFCCPSR